MTDQIQTAFKAVLTAVKDLDPHNSVGSVKHPLHKYEAGNDEVSAYRLNAALDKLGKLIL